MQKRNPINFQGVTGIQKEGNGALQAVAGGFLLLGFLAFLRGVDLSEKKKRENAGQIRKNDVYAPQTHCLRGLLGRFFKNGGYEGKRVSAWGGVLVLPEISPKNRVIDNRYTKTPPKGIASLITGMANGGFKPCRH